MDQPVTDAELIKKSVRGDQAAFGQLVDRYLQGVYLFAYRYALNVDDAEDIAQEAFFRAWKNIKKFDTSKNFKTWIFVIAKNIAFDLMKKKKPASFSQLATAGGQIGEDADIFETYLASYMEQPESLAAVLDRKFSRVDLDKHIAKLPEAYQTVLRMRYNEQMQFHEIAEALGEPINTIKSKHRRGLILLRKFFFV